MPPDDDGKTALHRVDTHEKVCTERYGSLWQAIDDLKKMVGSVQTAVTESNTQHHNRFNLISTRMWGLLAWVAASSVAGLGAIVFYLVTKGHP